MKNHTTQHLHYDDTFGDCTYSFHISIIVLEIAHTVFDSTTPMTAHTVFVTAPKWNDTLTWLQFLVSTYLQFFSVFLGEIGFKLQLVLYKETKKLSKEFFKFKLQPAWLKIVTLSFKIEKYTSQFYKLKITLKLKL